MVLGWLCAAGLQASIKKCEFHVTRTRYLGFILTTDGIEVDPEKMQVVHDWKGPSTVQRIQSFLGFCNFYQRFIKDYSRVAHPLDRLTKKETPFEWNENCQNGFEELKRRLTNAPVLYHYQPELETRLETDASDGVVAGVLTQRHEDGWHRTHLWLCFVSILIYHVLCEVGNGFRLATALQKCHLISSEAT